MGLRYKGHKSRKKTSQSAHLPTELNRETIATVDFFGFDERLFWNDLVRTVICTLLTTLLLLGIWWWGK